MRGVPGVRGAPGTAGPRDGRAQGWPKSTVGVCSEPCGAW